MTDPLISIITPFKNTGEYIEECLKSVMLQTYKNWELIAVNDSSTDTSQESVEKLMQEDNRIKVIPNKGIGIIEALRTGYSLSTGTFITRMDSDDIMKPNRLRWMLSSLLKYGKGHLAIGQVNYFSDRGISNGYERYENWLNKLTATGSNYNEIYKECVVPSPCWMTHRSDFDACGGFSKNTYPEDYDLAFRFYQNNLKCIPCKQILHLWRDYDTRTSRTSEHYAQNYFLDIKLSYFISLNYNSSKPLVIWGAGYKGKTIAKSLVEKKVDFYWVCDNPKKIGKEIYGKKMLHFSILEHIQNSQSIITVANEEAQHQIKTYFSKKNKTHMRDYFFFC